MNAKFLVLGAILGSLAGTSFANDSYLSPRAQGNQIKVVAAVTDNSAIRVTYVSPATVAPRARAGQLKVVKGVISDRNPALECIRTMSGSPKAVTACSQSVTMPGCMKLASE
jgi:hypothetical protein